MKKIIILGIDASKNSTGYFICTEKLEHIHSGTIKNKTLLEQCNIMQTLIKEYKVDCAGIEEEYVGRNKDTSKKLSRVQGGYMLLLGQLQIPYTQISISTAKTTAVKTFLTKNKKSEVAQVMYQVFGKFKNNAGNDISDAGSIAYAYIKTILKL